MKILSSIIVVLALIQNSAYAMEKALAKVDAETTKGKPETPKGPPPPPPMPKGPLIAPLSPATNGSDTTKDPQTPRAKEKDLEAIHAAMTSSLHKSGCDAARETDINVFELLIKSDLRGREVEGWIPYFKGLVRKIEENDPIANAKITCTAEFFLTNAAKIDEEVAKKFIRSFQKFDRFCNLNKMVILRQTLENIILVAENKRKQEEEAERNRVEEKKAQVIQERAQIIETGRASQGTNSSRGDLLKQIKEGKELKKTETKTRVVSTDANLKMSLGSAIERMSPAGLNKAPGPTCK